MRRVSIGGPIRTLTVSIGVPLSDCELREVPVNRRARESALARWKPRFRAMCLAQPWLLTRGYGLTRTKSRSSPFRTLFITPRAREAKEKARKCREIMGLGACGRLE